MASFFFYFPRDEGKSNLIFFTFLVFT